MKSIYKVFFTLLLLFNFMLMYIIYNRQNNNTASNKSNILVQNLINENEASFGLEGIKLTGNSYLMDTLKVILDKPKLVLKFTEESCSVCVDLALSDVKSLKKIINDKDIIIITSFNNEKYFNAYSNNFNKSYNIINIADYNKYKIYGTLKKSTVPQFFILNKDFTINCSYYYQKELPLLSKKYFNEIKNRFKKYPK